MGEIILPEAGEKKAGFSRRKNHSFKIDMTPMVDLGFLLIAFFIYSTRLSEPAALDLRMPADSRIDSSNLGESFALTLLLSGDNRVFYYHGNTPDALQNNRILETSFSYRDGIGQIIREKQATLDMPGKFSGGRRGLMLLIKPTKEASYKNVVDALDEALINDIKKYAVVEPTDEEAEHLLKIKRP